MKSKKEVLPSIPFSIQIKNGKLFLKAGLGTKKWRRGWESNPQNTVLQTVPLTTRAPRLQVVRNIDGFRKKASRLQKKIRFSLIRP